MERRVVLAFLLSFGVFLLFVRFFGPEPAEQPPAPVSERSVPPEPPLPDEPAEEIVTAPEQEQRAAAGEQTIRVRSRLFHAELTNRGARLTGFALQEHRDSSGAPYQIIPQGDERVREVRPLDVVLPAERNPGRLQDALHEVRVDGTLRTGTVELDLADGERREIRFEWVGADGLEVRKTLEVMGGEYRIPVEVSVQRGGAEVPKEVLYGPGVGEEPSEGTYVGADQGVLKIGGESVLYSRDDIREGQAASLAVQAVGISSHYFAGLLVAEPGQRYDGRLDPLPIPWESFRIVPEDASGNRAMMVSRLGCSGVARFTMYSGPKQVERLEELGVDIVEFGSWLRLLVAPIRLAILRVHDFTGNYGWAIILVTALINLLLAPLKHYSYVSIRGMQKISPQIKRIQERYRNLKPTDPRRNEMNREMMALYKEHGVSPVGGCLPMLLLMPFFFAFYRLLVVSVELRQAHFLFWVTDLSREDPYFILPILMGVSQLVMQKMSTTQAEGLQARIMMLMPLVFTIILAWAPSGLVLYWFANNILSMAQQAITTRILDRRAAAVEIVRSPSKKPGSGGKRSKTKR